MDNNNLLEVKNLKKYFTVNRTDELKAVNNVTFNIKKGETLGLVGESGCGKTTCGRTLVGIYDATDGYVMYNGKNIHEMNKKEKLKFKKKAQVIFQDPYASLDPRMTIGEIIGEGMNIHLDLTKKEKNKRISDLLNNVGLNREHKDRFPHELSGGQRQRVGIARALAVEPEFIMCDEPTSALDVSVQAQIINLLIKLQEDMNLTYLFISHDLSMVQHISDRIGVMYLGSIVEIAENEQIFENALHPYTKALLSAINEPDPKKEDEKEIIKLKGEVPSPINPPTGCEFRTRCKEVMDMCRGNRPKLKEVEENHFVACHLY